MSLSVWSSNLNFGSSVLIVMNTGLSFEFVWALRAVVLCDTVLIGQFS